MSGATDDQFLGALLGFAIGDALGMPVQGMSVEDIEARYGRLDAYEEATIACEVIAPGEITALTEFVLAIGEGLTTRVGAVDPETIGARFLHIAEGDSRRWVSPRVRTALLTTRDLDDFQAPIHEDGIALASVAARGVPIGLVHSVGAFEREALIADTEKVVRITDGGLPAVNAAIAVAYLMNLAMRGETAPDTWAHETAGFLGHGEMKERLSALADGQPAPTPQSARNDDLAVDAVPIALSAVVRASGFEDAVFEVINRGGDTVTTGALTGALAGARFGASGIPQPLIDGLGARIYVSLAAPWLRKAALRRSGTIIDLRPVLGGPRPPMPPRV